MQAIGRIKYFKNFVPRIVENDLNSRSYTFHSKESMVHTFEKWMEDDRISSLERDWENFNKEIAKAYGQSYHDDHRRRAEAMKNEYGGKLLTIIGVTAVVAIGGLMLTEGFVSGAIFVVTIMGGGFALHQHMKNEPDFFAATDIISATMKDKRRNLLKRQYNSEYDRRQWLSRNGHDPNSFSDLSNATVSYQDDESAFG